MLVGDTRCITRSPEGGDSGRVMLRDDRLFASTS